MTSQAPYPAGHAPDRLIVLSEGAANRLDGQWPDRICRHPTRCELHAYLAAAPARGRALVYAGGGYLQLMHDKEGVEIAQWLNSLGLDAYVLLHRLPGQDGGQGKTWPFDIALQDGLRALAHLASLPPLPLLHVGLSSGGHLAGVMACQSESAGAVIAYAPINANHRDHKAPAGKADFAPPEKQAFYDAWPIGIASEPHGLPPCPVFLAYALHDPIVPIEHALNLIKAAQLHGLDVDAHVFAQAEHGFALRALAGTQAQWPVLAAQWMEARLGAATY
ncbi:prolyl oligopeptidase family serine peptidase [Paucibacter sp. PLA-PC-4]|uniref:alpha/beta hydrolase n=1 Tax=Paucibacter sp. PLA-PC-4 TaxID=2993655 RepID=UPI00224AC69E|nr:prolyl oligopeptidase family serine peptidase [Paucibacter sp. PLA-PC-4]MCX2865066.1 prolyl oligopeptidase family serine peptidase [Paucibacter sp. PLA-PC-4]